jgi:hypothetical protein
VEPLVTCRSPAFAARLLVATLLLGCSPEGPAEEIPSAAAEAEVRAVCTRCHLMPPPEVLPRGLWRGQIEHMAVLSAEMPDLFGEEGAALPVETAVAWYEARAPEVMQPEFAVTRAGAGPLGFERRLALLGPGSGPGVATVAHVSTATREDRLIATNMLTGSIHLFTLTRGPEHLGQWGHPVRAVASEYVISDLGDTLPSDAPVGRVGVARPLASGGWSIETLLADVGRVADVLPTDLDADGDPDLVVAAFGWLRRGGVYVLHNREPAALRFETERVSSRSGAVRVVAGDPSRSLDADFVVGFSQHLEVVSAFRREAGGWSERQLFRAPHPNWGMSDVETADLDLDGDLDLLITNGDTLDDGFPWKPYHGVSWLVNDGAGNFELRRIGILYGAHGARAVDLDRDGDLDVVASGFLPQVEPPLPQGGPRIESLVWFEHTNQGFVPWALEDGHPRHTGLDIADVDADGLPDVVTGINTAWDARSRETGPSLELWLNRGPPNSARD